MQGVLILVAVMGLAVFGAVRADASYAADVLAAGPRGYWRLGEPSGTNAADAANAPGAPQLGAQNGVYTNGVTLGAAGAMVGDSDTAALFDGVNDYVSISDGSYQPTNYTIELWAKADTLRVQSMFVRTAGDPLGTYSHELLMADAGGGSYRFAHYTYDGATKNITGTTPIAVGNWYYVVGTFIQNGTMQLYVNGVADGTPVAVSTPWSGGAYYLIGSAVGSATYGPRAFFDGTLDDVAFYDRVLSPAEIAAHYQAAVPVPEPASLALLGLAAGGILARRRR